MMAPAIPFISLRVILMCLFNDLKAVYLLSHLGKVQVNGFYGNNKEEHSKLIM